MWIISNLLSRFNLVQVFCDLISKNSYYIYLYHILLLQILQWEILSRIVNLTIKYEFLITSVTIYAVIIVFCFAKNAYCKRIKKVAGGGSR